MRERVGEEESRRSNKKQINICRHIEKIPHIVQEYLEDVRICQRGH